MYEDDFNFFVPATALEISKAGDKKDGKWWIQGIASSNARDLQGEIVDQNGIDVSYFLKNGWFNDDHKPGAEHKVGLPSECRVTKNGLWVKGYLLKNEGGKKYWELMNALAADKTDRKVGFSIQGKVKRREGNKIVECWIQDIALTASPVNTTTWAEIAKSLSKQEWDLKKDDEKEEAEKAMTSDSVAVPESLDNKLKDNRVSKSLSYEEAVEFLKSSHGLPESAAIAVADVVFAVI